MKARDLMTTDVETVHPDDSVSEVLTRLSRADFNGFPVVEGGGDDEGDEGDGEDKADVEDVHGADGRVVGIVTQKDLVNLFQPSDRTLWIPVGLPPFLESLEYAVDLSWDELDVGIDLVKNAGRPVREIMTADVVTVDADDDLDRVLDLLADDERDINRLPVLEDGRLVGIVARQDIIRVLRDERKGTGNGR